MMRPLKIIALLASVIVLVAQTPVEAQEGLEIKAVEIPDRVEATSQGKPLIIHYTSDDGSCLPCIESNGHFEAAAQQLGAEFDFVSVTFNPWRQFVQSREGKMVVAYQSSKGFDLRALPSTMVFADQKPIKMLTGAIPTLGAELRTILAAISKQDSVEPQGIDVTVIPSSQFQAFVMEHSADKPVFLTLSSTDEGCPHCITGNEKVADASRFLSSDYVFARIDYNPWNSVVKDPPTMAYLKKLGTRVNGLPMSLVFYRGKLNGTVVTNGQDLRTVLSQALPSIIGD